MTINVQYAQIKSNMGNVLGLTIGSGKKIYIQRDLTKRKTFEVMVHELTHAALIHLKIKCSKRTHEYIAKKVGVCALRIAKQRKVV